MATHPKTLSSTHALVERYPQGDCWVILTNSGVWTGHHFSRDLQRLIERLRSRYGNEPTAPQPLVTQPTSIGNRRFKNEVETLQINFE